jgi:cytochrome c oxidase subunit IV
MADPDLQERDAEAPPTHGSRAGHPSAKEYVRIALILMALTGIEVWLSYSGLPHGLLITLLFIAAVIKFALVVLWFMHLKFDDRRYSRFFLMGLAGAFTLYLIVLLLFRVFARE